MSTAAATIPGLYFTVGARPVEPSPLRSDVAGFMGRTRRGTPGKLVRVEGWRAYLREFGGLDYDAITPYAVRGYFENGGQVAHVVRLCGPEVGTAAAVWKAAELDINGQLTLDSPTAFLWTAYRIEAGSPGKWARETQVTIRYRREGPTGKPEVDLVVKVPYEPIEYLIGLSPDNEEEPLPEQVERQSHFIRLVPAGDPISLRAGTFDIPPAPALIADATAITEGGNPRGAVTGNIPVGGTKVRTTDTTDLANGDVVSFGGGPPVVIANVTPQAGPRQIIWPTLTLSFDSQDDQFEPPGKIQYRDAIENSERSDSWGMADEPEIAIVSLPDLNTDVVDGDERWEILTTLISKAEASRDRLILIDVPETVPVGDSMKTAQNIARWVDDLRGAVGDERLNRAAAVYHPRLRVADPLGGVLNPLRCIPSSGHVAGVISRLDRERGAHHTPANAQLFEALDVSQRFDVPAQGLLYADGINLLNCAPGRGIQVWGGRTLSFDESGRFVAHRRLVHRLVRAIRRVAEPLVFYTNGPELWLTFVRSITTVLLEAYRAGALKGARPEEAFRVRCDEKTTTPEDIENGRMFCEIEIAPATPMEFIMLRIAVSADATLEVFEA